MKNEPCQPNTSPQSFQVESVLSTLKQIYTIQVDTLRVLFREKSKLLHEPTNSRPHILHFQKCTDKSFFCTENGQKILLKHQGNLTQKQLLHEIVLQYYLGSNPQCQ